ncbi:riboflavin biosynthesis protein RibF [Spiroplasma platyhelix]|uniref:Riboflavin biosynthesis protein n=1 Tax=Spiroplasma platyhelix PALS-1 TaxID=1276218 RepID=A0A846UCV6_9MOLU|nr:riboflavin biosynthesis protein RibF [Spiroplasma platyhelix]MBE4703975.1 Riboflavin biosynthesis protein RibF [Spiroplasma platyhelix PALS-1]NKE38348.1 riboflavin biosynthesis protein RibF [Spiroplasma platyhelix PALS-1]UJB29233.1 riboflavin kinase / FMN adenylyltransferase [Spiroplasma platyhelix PALS-1]
MKVTKINNLKTNFNQEKKPLIAIWGFFDGWHLGHQMLLKQMQDLAKQQHYQTLVVSFDVKPQNVLLNKNEPILLSNQDKQQFLSNQQVDYYCELKFSHELASSSAEEFINWLVANNVQAVVSAKDIHFGAKGQGNLATLQNSPLKVFISQDVFDENNKKVSSSYIKELIVSKNITHANKLLNRDGYTVTGTVVHGIKEGRALGFPTANLALSDNYVVPGVAVYISQTEVDGKWHQSMTVVVLRDGKLLVESYLLNFDQDIYDKVIKVRFLSYLRDSVAFDSKKALIEQINQDLVQTITYFKNAT